VAGTRAYECVYCHDLDRSHAINDETKKKVQEAPLLGSSDDPPPKSDPRTGLHQNQNLGHSLARRHIGALRRGQGDLGTRQSGGSSSNRRMDEDGTRIPGVQTGC